MRVIRVATSATPKLGLDGMTRTRPRAFAEWAALRRWGKLPARERGIVGYCLRGVREGAGMTQTDLAARLGVTQQAIAQAERWHSNPTVELLRRWAIACGSTVEITWTPAASRRKSQPGDAATRPRRIPTRKLPK